MLINWFYSHWSYSRSLAWQQLSACTHWLRSAFVLGIWSWCLEQPSLGSERHCSGIHLQASFKGGALYPSLRRFDDWFTVAAYCWTLAHYYRSSIFVILFLFYSFSMRYFYMYRLLLLSAAVHVCRGRYTNSVDWLIGFKSLFSVIVFIWFKSFFRDFQLPCSQ